VPVGFIPVAGFGVLPVAGFGVLPVAGFGVLTVVVTMFALPVLLRVGAVVMAVFACSARVRRERRGRGHASAWAPWS
jgi:hypothetical protein